MSSRLGAWLYRSRSWTPIPLVIAVLLLARPSPALLVLGALLLLCGEGIRIAGLRYLDATARSGRLHAEALATGGPYRFVRNPVYIGNAVLVAGFLVAAGIRQPLVWALAAVALTIQYGVLIGSEEAFLAGRFPDAFSRYRARVPRLLPRRAPYDAASPPRRGALEVVRAEFRTLHTLVLLYALIAFKGLVA